MQLRPYQVEAVEKAMQHAGFALFMEQRTGKTPTAIEIVRRRRPARLLIICPKVAIRVWRKHLAEASLRGMLTRVITFQSVWRARKLLRKWDPEMVIADESHRIKNHQSRMSKGARYVSRNAKWKLALTGTPVDKGPEEMWAQFDFINPSVFGQWSSFQDRYLVYGGFGGFEIIRRQNVREFQRKVEENSFRVVLDDVAPVKAIQTHTIVRFDLDASSAAYTEMLEKFMLEINGETIVTPVVIAQAMKLHQLTGGHIRDELGEVHRVGYEKAEHFGALLKRIGRQPVVVLCRFLEDMSVAAQICGALGYTVCYVSGQHRFEKFDTDVCIVQVQSGVAIDLSRAKHTIFYSMDYSYLNYDQSRFRIRAFNSTEVHYYYLLANDTIDVDIYEAVRSKQRFSKFLINRYRSSQMSIKKKVLKVEDEAGSIDLSSELAKVRSAITHITDEGVEEMTEEAKEVKKVAAKKPLPAARKTAAKPTKKEAKPAAKPKAEKAAAPAKAEKPAAKPAAKKTTAAATADGDVVTLAQLAAELKVAPAAARRKLRATFGEGHEGRARWEWKAGSKDLEKVRAALTK